MLPIRLVRYFEMAATLTGGTQKMRSAKGNTRSILSALCVLASVMTAEPTAVAETPTALDAALEHLAEVMDAWHVNFDVYTEQGAAGNHFQVTAQMGDSVQMDSECTAEPRSGATCIESRFQAAGDNWGGFYLLNGVLLGEGLEPCVNWGDTPSAGVDLSGSTRLTFWARGQVGAERVEFFACGVGHGTGAPYPDSSPKITLNYLTLSQDWKQYSIDVSSNDLSYVLGGFGWVTNASENGNKDIVFYLDDIQYDKARLDEPRFLVSYVTIPTGLDFDRQYINQAFTYDNALALAAFLARGNSDDVRRAGLIADAFVYATQHDRFFDDHRVRDAYQGGDLWLPPGWVPNGRSGTVRMPGWYGPEETWHENATSVGTSTGNVAWVILALTSYYEHTGDETSLDTAVHLAEWLVANTYDARGSGGYTGGLSGWEATSNHPEGQTAADWKSTEHNLDVYAAFARLAEVTGNQTWSEHALHAKQFVYSMWSEAEGRFWTGTGEDGVTPNTAVAPADVNAWALLALRDRFAHAPGVAWNAGHCRVAIDGFDGFDFNDDRDGVWFEGTAHMVLGYRMLGIASQADYFLGELERAQNAVPEHNGNGIVAASRDGLTTGFDWEYFRRLHVGATAWFAAAEARYNPFWNAAAGALGDVNEDGFVDAIDIQMVVNAVLGIYVHDGCDLNRDAFMDAVDIQLAINSALGIPFFKG